MARYFFLFDTSIPQLAVFADIQCFPLIAVTKTENTWLYLTHTHTDRYVHSLTKNHTCNVTFKYVSFLHQITHPRVHTWVQLQWRSRWCFHVCVALEYRRVLETSAQHSQGNGWRRLEKANQTAMISY